MAPIGEVICKLLWKNGIERAGVLCVHEKKTIDTNIGMFTCERVVVLPNHLREETDADVERQVCAFYNNLHDDLGVTCKAADDPEHGRCFVLSLPPEKRGEPSGWVFPSG